jgi:hypothetical protein
MENALNPFDQIVKSLAEKAPVKLDVSRNSEELFSLLKTVLKNVETELNDAISKIDTRIQIKFFERGHTDLEFKISDDVIIFSLHTDAYRFPESHPIWKSSYVQENHHRAFCGMISVYNFLTDSLKYNRLNDQGLLIARIFINSENHFFVEGKKQLGVRFNDFENAVINEVQMRSIAEYIVLHCLDNDIITPPFEHSQVISVQEILEKSLASVVATGKRLGFKLQSDSDSIQ